MREALFRGHELHIVETLVEVSGHISRKPYPKSKAGRRTVPLPRPLVDLLVEHRLRCSAGPDDWVFTNTAGGPVGRASFRTRIWRPAVARSGLPTALRFHDLRHSYATWLISEGVPANVVQVVLGHEQASITLDRYTHASRDYNDRIRRAFGDAADDPLTFRRDE